MKKDLKTFIGLILGAVLGYFIIQLLFEDSDSSMQSLIGMLIGIIITYAVIIGIKKAVRKEDEQE
ncbi:hypothetical protein [Planococcus salinarum]|uniref:hypothetical protein n=1 Tax=Planococcus salinarum TaxID=622695 RepID=UPI000E3E808A|nr:hypothetical protein [Planococcus salinarum]TAA69247.1 hypothetical protein D2909_13130 [Planococcus salinarum]